jgi:hypothetical protein
MTSHNDISIIASNADNWYSKDGKDSFPERDLGGKDDRRRIEPRLTASPGGKPSTRMRRLATRIK